MKKKILITAVSLLTVAACVGVVSAYGLPELKSTNKKDNINLPDNFEISGVESFDTKEERLKTDKEIEENTNNNSNDYDDEFAGLDEKFKKFDEKEAQLDKRDLKAYPILAKYYGEEYNKTQLNDDYDTEVLYMKKMCELYNSDNPTDEEKEILYNYVNRRTAWIQDMDLRMYFVEAIGAPY